jgi:PAS domain S-box-containing protein
MSKLRKSNESATPQDTALRKRAETMARVKAAQSPEETRRTLHELRVNQIELEMQNEELRRAHTELDAARARYFDLYDRAPVGYVTVSEPGLILEANLTAAALLGVGGSALGKQPISRFIHPEFQGIYYLHRKHLFETGEPQVCEMRMVKQDGTAFWADLPATAGQDAGGAPVCRLVVSDITERKRMEELLREKEERYRLLFENMMDRFAYCKMLFEDDRPQDFIYLAVNDAFEKLTGLKDVVGKKVTEVIPGIKESNPELFEIYGRVALSGKW